MISYRGLLSASVLAGRKPEHLHENCTDREPQAETARPYSGRGIGLSMLGGTRLPVRFSRRGLVSCRSAIASRVEWRRARTSRRACGRLVHSRFSDAKADLAIFATTWYCGSTTSAMS